MCSSREGKLIEVAKAEADSTERRDLGGREGSGEGNAKRVEENSWADEKDISEKLGEDWVASKGFTPGIRVGHIDHGSDDTLGLGGHVTFSKGFTGMGNELKLVPGGDPPGYLKTLSKLESKVGTCSIKFISDVLLKFRLVSGEAEEAGGTGAAGKGPTAKDGVNMRARDVNFIPVHAKDEGTRTSMAGEECVTHPMAVLEGSASTLNTPSGVW